jgi:hypothetical protein
MYFCKKAGAGRSRAAKISSFARFIPTSRDRHTEGLEGNESPILLKDQEMENKRSWFCWSTKIVQKTRFSEEKWGEGFKKGIYSMAADDEE